MLFDRGHVRCLHYSDVIVSAMASQITGVSFVCSAVCSGADKKRVTGLYEGNPSVTGGLPWQRASNTQIVSIWWRYHGKQLGETYSLNE